MCAKPRLTRADKQYLRNIGFTGETQDRRVELAIVHAPDERTGGSRGAPATHTKV